MAGKTEGVTAARIKNNVRLGACELGCHLRYLHSALRQRVLNDEVAAFDESLFLKSFPEAPDVTGGWWPDAQKADTARRCLLTPRGERPSGGTTDHCDEFATLHYRPKPWFGAIIVLTTVQ